MGVVYPVQRRCQRCGRRRPRSGWAELSDSGDPWLGRVVDGRYLLTRRLARGRCATVYQAKSLSFSRHFAIKIVDVSAPEADREPGSVRARLDREIEAVGRLDHPHLVPFYEVISVSDTCIGLVMKFVHGHTLDELIDGDHPLQWRRACRLARQIASGVDQAHRVGLIHRDLKPANIMVEQLSAGDEFIRVVDFGIVWMDDGVDVTHGFVGTPLYASPEQAVGDPVDRRSDIYSVGAILFEMLTGRTPFTSNNIVEVLRMHVRRSPPSVAEYTREDRHIPGCIDRLVERMLAKDRRARPSDLGEVMAVLDACSGADEVPAAANVAEPIGVDTRNRPAPVAQTATGLGVLAHVDHQRSTARTVETPGDILSEEAGGNSVSSAAAAAVESLAHLDRLFDPAAAGPQPSHFGSTSTQRPSRRTQP